MAVVCLGGRVRGSGSELALVHPGFGLELAAHPDRSYGNKLIDNGLSRHVIFPDTESVKGRVGLGWLVGAASARKPTVGPVVGTGYRGSSVSGGPSPPPPRFRLMVCHAHSFSSAPPPPPPPVASLPQRSPTTCFTYLAALGSNPHSSSVLDPPSHHPTPSILLCGAFDPDFHSLTKQYS